MMSSLQFGAARLEIDQAGLDYFADQSQRYMRYKRDFNELSGLTKKSAGKLKAMSDQTDIRLHSTSFYRWDDYSDNKHYYHMQLKATVSTKDTDRDKVISRTLQRSRLEPLSNFWRRVLRVAQKMDQVLAQPSGTEPDKDDPADKHGSYTFRGEHP